MLRIWIISASLLMAGDASAQSWPSKPVTYIVPFGAGSEPDVVCTENLIRIDWLTESSNVSA
jgi:tripartite-type tricarboxylate transporter receptor subunit TctC